MIDARGPTLEREDFIKAMKDMDSFIDVTVEDLMELNERATTYAQMRAVLNLCVRDFMTRGVVTIGPEQSLAKAARLLLEHNIAGLPVVDAGGRLTGVITETDLLEAVGVPAHHPPQTIWHTLEAIFAHHPRTTSLAARVEDRMAKRVVHVGEGASVRDVIDAMKTHRITRVIVTNDAQQVVGIVTRSNLIRVFLEHLPMALPESETPSAAD